jgi:CcmD family protein
MPIEVVATVLVIWTGLAVFIYRLYRKLNKIEGEMIEK